MTNPSIESYRKRQLESFQKSVQNRRLCYNCRRPSMNCYCDEVKPFVSNPKFVILMHPHEVKKAIGTGRMAYQCISNSELWIGADFAKSQQVHELLENSKYFPVLLYPGSSSINLSKLEASHRRSIFPEHLEPVIIVLDATWTYAKKMLHRSPNLQRLPRICFDPPHLSKFLLRKQPSDECFSSIEAIHEVLSLMGSKNHDHLMEVFESMVQKQLAYQSTHQHSRHKINYFKRKGLC